MKSKTQMQIEIYNLFKKKQSTIMIKSCISLLGEYFRTFFSTSKQFLKHIVETETSMLVFVPGLLSRNPGDQSYLHTATCSLPVQVLHPSVECFQIFPPGILPVTLSPGSCCSFFVPLMTWSLIWFLGACEFLPLQCFTLEQQRCYNISISVCLVMCVKSRKSVT